VRGTATRDCPAPHSNPLLVGHLTTQASRGPTQRGEGVRSSLLLLCFNTTGVRKPQLLSLAWRAASRFCRSVGGRSSGGTLAGLRELILQFLLLRAAEHGGAARRRHVVYGGIGRGGARARRRVLRQSAERCRRAVGDGARTARNGQSCGNERWGKNPPWAGVSLEPSFAAALPLPVSPHVGSAVTRASRLRSALLVGSQQSPAGARKPSVIEPITEPRVFPQYDKTKVAGLAVQRPRNEASNCATQHNATIAAPGRVVQS
jgi:hypothetical protein